MKKRMTLMLATLGLMAGLAVVPASAQEVMYRARVPFSFVVLGKTLPAGEYSLIAAPHMVKIEDSNRVLMVTVLANEISERYTAVSDQIVFHCYSEGCFLAELHSRVRGNSRQVLTSAAEAESAKKEQMKYFAVLGEKPRQ